MLVGPPPDEDVRQAIRNDLDSCLVVEAAAGSGKTTCLTDRLLNLLARGALSGGRRLAAVTFTHKAAAELRERLDGKLEKKLSAPEVMPPAERENLERAAGLLPECHLGTIHSFCGRLIRERPIEAGVGPDFRGLDDREDAELRLLAWSEFSDRLQRGGWPEIGRVFGEFGLDAGMLREGFERFAAYPDVERWPGRGLDARPDGNAFLAGLDSYLSGMESYLGQTDGWLERLELAAAGNDGLVPILRRLMGGRERRRTAADPRAGLVFLEFLKKKPSKVYKPWLEAGFGKEQAEAAHAAYAVFQAEVVASFRQSSLAKSYAAVLEAFFRAREIYDRRRREAGGLNFQDLLLGAARLLRDYPRVRSDLADRYARILVDETQDTDPVQAEIMFLLASADPEERNWRACRPRPGSLFIVGDPKQSIYRFRRADMAVYQEVKRLIAEAGGRRLQLTANFRGQPAILDWVNRFFGPNGAVSAEKSEKGGSGSDGEESASGGFSSLDSPYGPAYVPLIPVMPAAPENVFSGVYRLETLPHQRNAGVAPDRIFADEAERIARFIRHAVDSGLLLPDRNGGARPAGPGDFLVAAMEKKRLPLYVRAMRRLGLECSQSGGASLADSRALRLLAGYVRALAFPEDPILALAAIRGGLFGLSDANLYEWSKLGGDFRFASAPPGGGEETPAGSALALMERHRRLFMVAAPIEALELATEELGLWPLSCLEEEPAVGAGKFAVAMEILRREESGLTSLGKLAERLAWLSELYEEDVKISRPVTGGAVRVMNVHKAKGLEAPVVFLACTRWRKRREVEFAATRSGSGSLGAMRVGGAPPFSRVLAQPPEWEELAEEEERFMEAERVRLNYVAATRAGAALVLSLYPSGKTWKSHFVPGLTVNASELRKLPEPPADWMPIRPYADIPGDIDPEKLLDGEEMRKKRSAALLSASGGAVRAKPETDSARLSDEAGVGFGEALHRLLALEWDETASGRTGSEAMAEAVLRECGRPVGLAGELAALASAARESHLWKRAVASGRLFRETPYTLLLPESEGGGLERGVIDLAFREPDGWVIADYKSGAPPDPAAEAARHEPQLAAYARAWERLTGEKVKETGVYFLHGKCYAASARIFDESAMRREGDR